MTFEESIHLSRVAALGCIVCKRLTGKYVPAEIHHIRHGMGLARRATHFQTIPLCPRHHRSGSHGEAYHAGARTWEEKYGSELELLEIVASELQRLKDSEEFPSN